MERDAESQPLCGKCGVRARVSAKRRYCRECFAAAQRESMKRKADDWAKLRRIVLKRSKSLHSTT